MFTLLNFKFISIFRLKYGFKIGEQNGRRMTTQRGQNIVIQSNIIILNHQQVLHLQFHHHYQQGIIIHMSTNKKLRKATGNQFQQN